MSRFVWLHFCEITLATNCSFTYLLGAGFARSPRYLVQRRDGEYEDSPTNIYMYAGCQYSIYV